MGYVAIALTIMAAVTMGGLLTFGVHSVNTLELRRNHHDAGSIVFLQFGVIYAVLLAFVFNEVWSDYDAAAQAINRECGALHGTAMLATTFAPGQAQRVLSAEQDYIGSVIRSEWPAMTKHRTESGDTDRKMQVLITEVANLRPVDLASTGIRNQMLVLLAQAHSERETRIYQADKGTPVAIWAILIFLGIVLVVCVAFSSIHYRGTAIIIAGVFAGGIVSILLVVRLLDYPFEGALALQPVDFSSLLMKVSALQSSV